MCVCVLWGARALQAEPVGAPAVAASLIERLAAGDAEASWAEGVLQLLHGLLGTRPPLPLTAVVIQPLLRQLQPRASIYLAHKPASAKFCNVLFALIKGYGPSLRSADRALLGDLLRQLTEKKCFLAKPALKELGRLPPPLS